MRHLPLLPLPVLAFLVVCLAAGGARGQGVPKLLPGDLALGPAGGVQQLPAVAAGASGHLVAWADHRSAFETLGTGVGTRDVYAQRLDAAGNPLAPMPFRVAGGLGRKKDVQVAWNGAMWLVTWKNELPTTYSKAWSLVGARVDAQGNVLDDPPLMIRAFSNSGNFSYAIASDGADWAVASQGYHSTEAAVDGRRVSASGAVSLLSSSLFATTQVNPGFRLAWDGTQYLFTWNNSGVQGRRFTAAFAPLSNPFTIAPADANEGSVAADRAGGFLVAWSKDFNGYAIEYRRVTAAGGLGGTVQAAAPSTYGSGPCVAWNGNGFTLAWTSGAFPPTSLRYAQISSTGVLLHPGGLPLGQGAAPQFAAIASLGNGEAQLAWVDKPTTPPHPGDILGTRITAAGLVPAVDLSTGAPRQGAPDIAAGGPGYLAVFTSERAGAISILAQRLDPQGNALDPQPIELDAGAALGHPRVAWNGSVFLVVWQDELGLSFPTDDLVRGRRVAADGTLPDPAPFQVMQGATPDVDAAGGLFLVAARYAFTTQIFYTHAVRLDGAGTLLDPSPLLVGGNYARFPSVGSFGDRWIVAWQRNPTHDNPSASARARVVLTSGAMLADVSIGAGSTPAVAASGTTALVAWRTAGLSGQRLDRDGNYLGAGATLVSSGFDMLRPGLAWDGARFVLAWEDLRHQAAWFDDRRDVFAARIAEDGTVLDGPSGLAVADSAEDEQLPAVAGAGGAHLFAVAGFLPHAPHAAVRTLVVEGGAACSTQIYCVGAPNSAGAGARMGHTGTASVAANHLVLTVAGAVPSNPGMFFYGGGQTQIPFHDGFLCVSGGAAGVFRLLPAQISDPSGAASLALDLTAPPSPSGLITAGSTWNFQYWYRDPAGAGGTGANLSDALSVTFCP
jgi:hypothetical protein